jgi:hypothetical protein
MRIVINTPTAGTNVRNTTEDRNGLVEESDVKTVDVFIYTSSGALESHTPLTASSFTQTVPSNGDYDKWSWASAEKIATTTGPKVVYVGINLPASVVAAVEAIPTASDMEVAAQAITRDQMTGAGGFVMFSTAGVACTFVSADDPSAETANSVSVDVERLVAKVTVETAASFDKSGLPGTLLDELQFTVTNFNTRAFLIQEASVYHKDPNWTLAQYTADAATFDTSLPAFKNVLTGTSTPAAKEAYSPDYASENTSEGKTKKEVTRAVVRGTFIPAQITWRADEASQWEERDNDVTSETPAAEKTFYAVTPGVASATRFFTDAEMAAAFAEENDVEETTYTDGLCYWDIFLGKDPYPNTENKWDVLRNDYYKCTITRIINLGRNNPAIPDPNVTPDNETAIETTINVLFWHNELTSNYEL